MSLPKNLDPRDDRYIKFLAHRSENVSDKDIASTLGFDSPEELYRRLTWDGFPVCGWCGATFVGEDHCEPAEGWKQLQRQALYVGGLLQWPLFLLVSRWMEELARVGLMPEVRKQAGRLGGPPVADARPVPLEGGETIYIRPEAFLDEKGYNVAEVLDRPLKTDVAILAALAVLEGGEGPTTTRGQPDKDLLRAAYNWRKPWTFDTLKAEAEADVRCHRKDFDLLPSGERERLVGERQEELWQEGKNYCWNLLLKRTEATLRTSGKKFNKLPVEGQGELAKEHARRILDESELLLELAEAEVRFYRGDFEKLPDEDQKDLIVGNAERISIVAAAAHKHAEYLERWRVGKTTTEARRYVRAAELKDIEGLKDPEVAQRLGIEQAPSEKSDGRSDNSKVRHATEEGRKILNILHGGRWTEYAKQQRSKIQR